MKKYIVILFLLLLITGCERNVGNVVKKEQLNDQQRYNYVYNYLNGKGINNAKIQFKEKRQIKICPGGVFSTFCDKIRGAYEYYYNITYNDIDFTLYYSDSYKEEKTYHKSIITDDYNACNTFIQTDNNIKIELTKIISVYLDDYSIMYNYSGHLMHDDISDQVNNSYSFKTDKYAYNIIIYSTNKNDIKSIIARIKDYSKLINNDNIELTNYIYIFTDKELFEKSKLHSTNDIKKDEYKSDKNEFSESNQYIPVLNHLIGYYNYTELENSADLDQIFDKNNYEENYVSYAYYYTWGRYRKIGIN